jgi:FkbM family methyltransferase
MRESPYFSVVIPTYERAEDLKKCLNALSYKNQTEAPLYEVIVSDDSKSTESKKLVENEFKDVIWNQGKKKGPAANRNAGVAIAKGKWIVFIDDDCVAQKGYLKAYEQEIKRDPDLKVMEGRIFPDRRKNTWAEGCPANENGGLFWTSNLCINKNIFNELGGLDERFAVAFEDVDFAYRFKSANIKAKFVYDAAVCHPWRTLKQQGKNWKPIGYEWQELQLFLEKHPNASEHSSPLIYIRHFKRMITKDIIQCALYFKFRGFQIWLNQLLTTMYVIIKLIKPVCIIENLMIRHLPVVFSFALNLRKYPNYEKIIYLKNIKKGNKVLDLGANIGRFSSLFGKLVGINGKVYCFEPVTLNYRKLQQNTSNMSWIQTYKLAVSDKCENTMINFSIKDLEKSTLKLDNNLHNSKKENIKTITIDKFLSENNLKNIDFVKCDLEGLELEALYGMENLLKKEKPKLAIEITLDRENRKQLISFLSNCGYSNFKKIEKGFPKINPDLEIPQDEYFYLYTE